MTFVEPDAFGCVTADQICSALRPDTILVSVMHANNEIGTVEPIAAIGNAIQKYRREKNRPFLVFHTDACQASGFLELGKARAFLSE